MSFKHKSKTESITSADVSVGSRFCIDIITSQFFQLWWNKKLILMFGKKVVCFCIYFYFACCFSIYTESVGWRYTGSSQKCLWTASFVCLSSWLFWQTLQELCAPSISKFWIGRELVVCRCCQDADSWSHHSVLCGETYRWHHRDCVYIYVVCDFHAKFSMIFCDIYVINSFYFKVFLPFLQ